MTGNERSVRAAGRVVTVSLSGGLVALAALAVASGPGVGRSLPVLLPLLATAGCAAVYVLGSRRRDGAVPVFEVGSVYVAVVTLYTAYPLIGFLVNGLGYGRFNDGRLRTAAPTPDALAEVAWLYVAHLFAFVTVYLMGRGRAEWTRDSAPKPDLATVVAALFVYVLIGGYLLFLGQFFDLTARSYVESYLVSKRLPLELAQLMNHLGGARFTLELVILAWLFAHYSRCRMLIAGWIGIALLTSFLRLGSRTELVLLGASAAMMYHYMVRPLALRHVASAGLAGLGVFALLGSLRLGWRWFGATGDVNPVFGYPSEFETIFANVYHLISAAASGQMPEVPTALRWADVLALVPQQILPLTKVDPADWYVRTFHPVYAASGGGLAFGTISEAILGDGMPDVLARGAALGFLLAWLHRYHSRSQGRFWAFILYVWVTVLVYRSFRATTFVLVSQFLYQFAPVALAVIVLGALARDSARPRGTRAGHAATASS